jgi:hypothetical protein
MIILIEPIRKVIIEDRAFDCKPVSENYFGGFCDCGGLMIQKFWVENENKSILISECERCWNNEAMIFDSKTFRGKEKVTVYDRFRIKDYLSEVLSFGELEAIVNKVRGKSYKPSSLSRAKKKLESLDLDFNEILQLLK